MTLHRELIAAFAQSEPADVGNVMPDNHSSVGCLWRKIDFSLILNSSGELIDVDEPPWRMSGRRRRNTLLVPQKQFMGEGVLSGFLWGHSLHALGVGRHGKAGDLKVNTEAFNRFRTFHRALLGRHENPSIRALLQFLDRWQPEAVQDGGVAAQIAGGTVVFRFHYEDRFLHESHAARLIWLRLLNPAGLPAA